VAHLNTAYEYVYVYVYVYAELGTLLHKSNALPLPLFFVKSNSGGVARGYASTLQRRAQNLGGAKF